MVKVCLRGCSIKQNRILTEVFKRSVIYSPDDYVHVPAESFGRDYTQALEGLIEKSILLRDNHYQVGKFSRSYWIPLYIQEELEIRPKDNGPSFTLRGLESPWCNLSAKWMIGSFRRTGCEIGPFARDPRLRLLAMKKLFFVKDTTAGRIHTNITGLKRESRAALRLDGEPLIEIDMVNCQPFLLGQLSREESFMDYCQKGLIYEHLANHLSLSRDDAKELYFKTIYGRIEYANRRLKEFFACEFPETWATITQSKEFDHANLAINLQKAEVAMMEVVWSSLARLEIPFLTIHDAILVKMGDLDKAVNLMNSPDRPQIQVKHDHSSVD